MPRLQISLILVATFIVLACPSEGISQTYSYVDENGIRIYTNIPPKAPVHDLKLSGAPPAAVTAPSPSKPAASPFDPIIEKYAGQFQLDPALVRSMIAQESGFKPHAVSRKGAQGLMQLMPATAARIGVRDSFDPEENIRGGMKHMRNLLDTFDNDLVLSLAAYNAGENLVQRIGRVPNYRETHEYVRSITRKYGKSQMTREEPKSVSRPSLFRFTDRNGVLHLTNLPPVQREEVPPALWTASEAGP